MSSSRGTILVGNSLGFMLQEVDHTAHPGLTEGAKNETNGGQAADNSVSLYSVRLTVYGSMDNLAWSLLSLKGASLRVAA